MILLFLSTLQKTKLSCQSHYSEGYSGQKKSFFVLMIESFSLRSVCNPIFNGLQIREDLKRLF